MRVITSFDELEPVPWANGAGETTELVSLTDSQTLTPSLRRWRLSIARLDRPAVFSPLPGLARTFLPIGAEVALEIDGEVHPVTSAEPKTFRGEQTVSLVELGAPCFALNLMVEDSNRMVEDSSGSESEQRALEMSTRFAGSGQFAITLNAVPDRPRFQLLRLDDDDEFPYRFDAAILH
ncbi:HutD family protein [Brevibacterium marinum]|uniref:Environmental stress-induced protein Ves n=1 Tax=Brevibacterium marinum TaxID=418643 RepID=A0A846RWN6_9MICO|nr:HutD family protein [Brevibacterium marinum]NJC58644.1 environmental stress-induced protein Ves [Brevibacterium marinum]